MKKSWLGFAGALALCLGTVNVASACEGDCDCPKDKKAEKTAKAEKVALEGTVVTFGCPMEAAAQQCTGAALVVGETKHMIKKAAKGKALVAKTKDSNKVVKVTGTKAGEFLTVDGFQIKG